MKTDRHVEVSEEEEIDVLNSNSNKVIIFVTTENRERNKQHESVHQLV